MHELTIAQSILAIAEKALPPDAGGVVSAVQVEVGALSSIETDSLLFAFDTIKSGTLLEDAALQINIINGQAGCSNCHEIFQLNNYGDVCPRCGGYALKILSGREMKVLSIVVEE